MRLCSAGLKTTDIVLRLAQEFQAGGADGTAISLSRGKGPYWTEHEAARLWHVINSPRNSTVLAQLYGKPGSRAQIDKGLHDLWANEFSVMFNDDDFTPALPVARDDATDDLLGAFETNLHPHRRDGASLKFRWRKLRKDYLIATRKYSQRGQTEPDCFPNFTDGDLSIPYMHCVFYGSPALEYALRVVLDNTRLDEGLQDIEEAREVVRASAKRRRLRGTDSRNSDIQAVAEALQAPMRFEDPSTSRDSRFTLFDLSDRMATTVDKLMDRESNQLEKIEDAENGDNSLFLGMLVKRRETIQTRINMGLSCDTLFSARIFPIFSSLMQIRGEVTFIPQVQRSMLLLWVLKIDVSI